jgi:PAS domain S-box-containing protein
MEVNMPFEFSQFVPHPLRALSGPRILRYGFAVLAVLIAAVLGLALNTVLDGRSPSLPFTFAILVVAGLAGRGPGFVATGLSALTVAWFYLPPLHSLAIQMPAERWELAFFLVTGALISLLVGNLRDAFLSRARADEALRRKAQLIDFSHDAVITMDADGRIVTWNKGAEQMYGWAEAEVAGQVTHDLLQTVGGLSIAQLDEIRSREGKWDGELEHITRSGRRIVTESRHVLVRDKQNRPAGLLEINRDITARKEAEAALLQIHDQEFARAAELQAVMDAMPIAVFIARDPECRNMIGNRKTYELFRVPPGRNLSKSAPEGERPSSYRIMKYQQEIPPHELPIQKAAATGEPVGEEELEVVFPDGTRRDVLGAAVPLFDAKGRLRGAVGTFMDITERKQTDERLRHKQKLESIGVLAGGVAHDFNNLLTVIMGGACSVLLEHPTCEQLNDVIAASERAADLTKQLLAYAGKSQFVKKTTFDLNDLVSRSTQLLSASMPKKVKLVFNLWPEELCIEADPSQIEQILVNLVINAAEAIPPQTNGRVEIVTSICDVTAAKAQRQSGTFDIRPGRFVCVEVRDNGCGMNEATISQIFDPFFSTKFTGRGLGLAAVHGIVQSFGGFVEVLSAPDEGTTFRVHLPFAAKPCPAEQPVDAEASTSRRQIRASGAILVVDDEDLVRKSACLTLRRRGFDVLEAQDGREALEVLAATTPPPSLALVDLSMPVMGGDELVPILNQRYPDLKIVVTSGYPEKDARKGFSAQVAGFLQKPYTAISLSDKVDEALGARVP